MTRARGGLAAAVASTVWLLALAAPAWAATMSFDNPRQDDPYFRSADDGNVVVRGTVTSDDRNKEIEGVTFAFSPGLEASGPCREAFVNDPGEITIADDAQSASFELVISAPCNRSHEVAATVTYRDPLALGLVRPEPETTRPLRFAVAVPPAPVQGVKATYDPATKKVELSWARGPEPDLIGYQVERNPPGPDGWAPLGGRVTGTSFTDTLTVDDEHSYRVLAIRSGPDATIRELLSEPDKAKVVKSGPDRPEPTVPDTALVRPPASSSASSRASANRGGGGGAAPARRGTAATIDDGFNRNLPFDPSATTTIPASPDSVPPEDAAVLAIDDDSTDEDSRRATMVPIAGGLALMMAAVHLRLLAKRAAEPELPIYATSEPRR